MNRQQTHRIKEQGFICKSQKKKLHLEESIKCSSHTGKENGRLREFSNRQELPLLK